MFTVNDIKKLREKTHAGMLDCKIALEKSNGDFDIAVKLLREKGHIMAGKRATKVALEGIISLDIDHLTGVASMLELNSETDFVAKNNIFIDFAKLLNNIIIQKNPSNIDELLKNTNDENILIKDILADKIMSLGENIKIKKFIRYDNNTFNIGYTHTNNNIGVLLGIVVDNINSENKNEIINFGKDICMQIASMQPKFLSKNDVDNQSIENEKEILLQQAINDGKNKEIAKKIVLGRINKFYEENCLLEQIFIKDNTLKINDYIKTINKKLNINIKIDKFNRFEKGENY